ncbi:hypothetical protein SAMN04489812_0493 [Microlunatus soli]|uniref:Uncharacterized protein n=2 Tax=Microlunatus soli TaxID=630515 RepID=A0A1H1NEN4_9ACTN|nr:hypothetical protein SAMN04489812_0493 [Microlunatus soli]
MDGIVQLVRWQTQLISLTLLAATILVPVAAFTADEHDGSDRLSVDRHHLFGLIARMPELGEEVEDLAESHPYAAQGGLVLIGIGVAVLLIGLLATAVAVLTSLDKDSAKAKWLVGISLAVLVLGTLLVAIGLGWFPDIDAGDDERAFGPSWGLLVPLVAAIWIGVGRARLVDLT